MILPGSRVLVFDPRLFIDDIATPLNITMQPATVIQRYSKIVKDYSNVEYDDYGHQIGEIIYHKYDDIIDVIFDYDMHRSNCHFLTTVKELEK
jgi:hypothetical protein